MKSAAPEHSTGRAESPGRSRGQKLRLALSRLLVIFAVVFSLRYFYWRATATMNPAARWFFYLFLAAELLSFLESALFYFTTWKPTQHAEPAPLPGQTVDVFITTYNEPLSLVRETVVCAVSMAYPHRTYLLDDGTRSGVEALAREFGCGYLARSGRTDAKAGNLNHGLAHTEGDFIVTLDADHVPMPDLIDRLIGFFRDPRIAIVQTAQDFYNLDSFQHLTKWERRYAWQQQELFFSVVQPGKDAYDAAFYCGSPAMVRRRALEEIGGFATGSITEDMHSGVRLQMKGWRVLYFNHTFARGLAPQTYPGFATQWLRWGHGAMQVLRQENPLFGRGLSLPQRICYFASFYFYWMSYQKLLFVLTPIFCLLTGIFPLVAAPKVFALYFLPYFLLNIAASAGLQGGLHSFLLSEEFNLVKLPVLMRTILGLRRRAADFRVTPKSQAAAAHWGEVWLQLSLLGGVIASFAVGTWRLARAHPGYVFWAVAVNLCWGLIYLWLLVPVVSRALRQKEMRASYRFPSRLEVPVQYSYGNGNPGRIAGRAFARNLNRFGFSLTGDRAIPLGTVVEAELLLPQRTVLARGRVVRNQAYRYGSQTRMSSGVRFEQIEPRDQDEISKHLFWEVAPRHGGLLRLTQKTQKKEPTDVPS